MEVSTLTTERPHHVLGIVSSQRVFRVHVGNSIASVIKRKNTQSIEETYQQIIYRHKELILEDCKNDARKSMADAIIGFKFEMQRIELEHIAVIGYGTAIKFTPMLDILEIPSYNDENNHKNVEKTKDNTTNDNLEDYSPTFEDVEFGFGKPKIDIGGDSQMNIFRERLKKE